MICPDCGGELHVGDFPFCHGQPDQHTPRQSAVIGDEWPEGGGRWIDNLDHEPVWCQTKSDLQREMDARNLRHPDRHVPGDTQLSDWSAGMDAVTLENARILVARHTETTAERATRCESLRTYVGPVHYVEGDEFSLFATGPRDAR